MKVNFIQLTNLLALILIILLFFDKLIVYTFPFVTKTDFDYNKYMKIINIITFVVQISIAIWLYIISKKESKYPIIWALLGILFGIAAVVLYYWMEIYKRIEPTINNNGEKQTHDNS
jgi:hypothetical protein